MAAASRPSRIPPSGSWPGGRTGPTISVVIAAFSDERWPDLVEAVESVAAQTSPPLETIVVIDHNAGLLARAISGLPGVRVLENRTVRGASGARNTGVADSHGGVVAFLDDDAVAEPDWLENLVSPFTDLDVIGVGGLMLPVWSSERPSWFAPEFDWVVGATYRGITAALGPVRNVWSENMAIRREVFDAVGGFRLGFGKTGSRSRPEDTDLCLRSAAVRDGTVWIFQPLAVVHHKVPAHRESLGFFIRRCYAEGQGKAELGAMLGRGRAMATERSYARRVLPRAVAAGIGEALRGDVGGLARSATILLGAGAAATGVAQIRLLAAASWVRHRPQLS